jgi:hypothetical protein
MAFPETSNHESALLVERALEMTEYGKHGKRKSRLLTHPSHTLWKSLRDSRVTTASAAYSEFAKASNTGIFRHEQRDEVAHSRVGKRDSLSGLPVRTKLQAPRDATAWAFGLALPQASFKIHSLRLDHRIRGKRLRLPCPLLDRKRLEEHHRPPYASCTRRFRSS